jgi:hypothetical protein
MEANMAILIVLMFFAVILYVVEIAGPQAPRIEAERSDMEEE